MNVPTSRYGRRGTLAAAAATVVLAVAGTLALSHGLHPTGGAPQPTAVGPVQTPRPPGNSGTVGTASGEARAATELNSNTLARSRPVRLTIASIGVDTHTIVALGKQPDGSLQVPARFDTPGWFTAGPAPGQLGPAVLAGHVDSTTGPGIFYRLGALRPGALVLITLADGSTARFTVDRVVSYPKNHFPTLAVYGATPRAELRLITCGGQFDHRTGHYLNNTVAYAHLL